MSDYLTRLRGVAKDLEWKSEGGASVGLHGGMKSWLGHDIADAVDEIDRLRAKVEDWQDELESLHSEAHDDPCTRVRCWVTAALTEDADR